MILITAGFKAKLFTAKTIKAEPCFLYIPAGMSICDERKSRFTLCSPHNYDPCTLRARINTQKVLLVLEVGRGRQFVLEEKGLFVTCSVEESAMHQFLHSVEIFMFSKDLFRRYAGIWYNEVL